MTEHPNDTRASVLLTLGQRVACDMRDDVYSAWRVVEGLDRADLEALCCVLAAMVPVDVPVSALAWWRFPRSTKPAGPQPCGTRAAYKRHKARGEDPCAPCVAAQRQYEAGIKRAKRAERSAS